MVVLAEFAVAVVLLVASLWVYPETRELARDATMFALMGAVECAWIAVLGWAAIRL